MFGIKLVDLILMFGDIWLVFGGFCVICLGFRDGFSGWVFGIGWLVGWLVLEELDFVLVF
jgi:hypothetical protein